MQRYSRDRDRDDEAGRSERGSQARNEDRYSQGQQRPRRDEFGGHRGSNDDRSSSYEASAYGTNQGPGRWRESSSERDRFEETYGRGGREQHGDYDSGRSMARGGRDDDDRGNWNETGGRAAWRPGSQPMEPRRGQYGETEYGGYGPRSGSSYTGGAAYGSGYGTYGGGSQFGNERGDDRYGRQGYGQSGWQQDHERGQHHRFDPHYQQWREEQIRNLDDDYRTYRQERYRKFSDEFDAWRKNRRTGPLNTETGTGTEAPDTSSSARDSLGVSKNTK